MIKGNLEQGQKGGGRLRPQIKLGERGWNVVGAGVFWLLSLSCINAHAVPSFFPRDSQYSLYVRPEYRFEEVHFRSSPPPRGFDPQRLKDDNDQDFLVTVGFNSKNFLLENLDTSVSFRYERDLDGTTRSSPFRDSRDAFGNAGRALLFRAAATLRNIYPNLDVTLGRQYFHGAETVHFDGGTLDYHDLEYGWGKLDFSAFVGHIVYLYTVPNRGDVVVGSSGRLTLSSTDTQLRLSNVYFIDHTLEFSVFQPIGRNLDVYTAFTLLNNEAEGVLFNTLYRRIETGTAVELSVNRRFGASFLRRANFDFTSQDRGGVSDFFETRLFIDHIHSSTNVNILLTQELTQRLALQGGYERFQLDQERADGNAFNASSDTYRGGLSLRDFPWRNLRGSVFYVHQEFKRLDVPLRTASTDIFDDIRDEGERRTDNLEISAVQTFFNRRVQIGGGYTFYLFDNINKFLRIDGGNAESFFAFVSAQIVDGLRVYARYERVDQLDVVFPEVDHVQGFRLWVEKRF